MHEWVGLERKIEKERVFDLMRKRGCEKAWLQFEGGHDQGAVDEIRLYSFVDTPDKNSTSLPLFSGYRIVKSESRPDGVDYVSVADEERTDDETLASLLCAPIDAEFGSWSDQPSTWGTLVWNAKDETVTMDYEEDRPFNVSKSF